MFHEIIYLLNYPINNTVFRVNDVIETKLSYSMKWVGALW
jgi:hypothetical protein